MLLHTLQLYLKTSHIHTEMSLFIKLVSTFTCSMYYLQVFHLYIGFYIVTQGEMSSENHSALWEDLALGLCTVVYFWETDLGISAFEIDVF